MYHTVIVAGTFDGLHKGHVAVLTRAFAEGEKVIIGLTSDAYIQKFKATSTIYDLPSTISPYEQRKQILVDWLQKESFLQRSTIVPLDDPYGPALTEQFDALIVTTDNKKRGEEINIKRKEKGLSEVALIEVPLVPAEDLNPISSSRVRAAEIDGEGHLILPDALRPELAQPLGKILVGEAIAESIEKNKEKMIITVGDLTTKTLLDAGVTPALSIIDGRLMRQPFAEALDLLQQNRVPVQHVKSGPGYISKEARLLVEKCLQGDPLQKSAMVIEGEEDLLTLPAVVYAPIGAVLYYGQPAMDEGVEGMVEVHIDAVVQTTARALLSRFVGE